MKQKNNLSTLQEIDVLLEQLDTQDMYIISYLKGFDRKLLKEMTRQGLFDIYLD